jgi:putative DNA methylase
MSAPVVPFSLKDAPALIERLLPVQKLSAEAYKEQMANVGKTLTALGSYWKGRKPLILAKACVLGCLLPVTNDPVRDLEIFEKLMAMDDESFAVRWKRRFKPKEILATVSIARITDYFTVEPEDILPTSAPVDWSKPEYAKVKVAWREDPTELERRRLEAQMLPRASYRERVEAANRPEEVMGTVHDHIWDAVNHHLGTSAHLFPELTEQLGIMRFGHRPRVADTFCGSGQIPFEAARLGCDVYASDLNPVACMLTWAAFHIVGGSAERRSKLVEEKQALLRQAEEEIDRLGVETDGQGWRGRVYLYCIEARCPSSGWMVPLLPSCIVCIDDGSIAELVPDPETKRYEIKVFTGVSKTRFRAAARGTVVREGRFSDAYLMHQVDGVNFKTKISTLRGDSQQPDGTIGNRLRLWEKHDLKPRVDDIFQERLYCIQWMRPKKKGKGYDFEFRTVTEDDLKREHIIEKVITEHLADWQAKGWVPDMRIEIGGPPRYQGLDLIRARGWTHWHHVFNPRQLLVNGLLNRYSHTFLKPMFAQALQYNARLCTWHSGGGGRAGVQNVFSNQALNTLYQYGSRSLGNLAPFIAKEFKSYPLPASENRKIAAISADSTSETNDIYITDPPYGDAIKYEEILDFFIAWLRKNPPPEFADWVWDSRRSLAIQGEGEDFRRSMVAAYRRMTKCMPDNGIQVIMFTHKSESIWADMANIVWASGLHVTAAWYVATETDSALREGSHVKGTVLLVLRKRQGTHKTTRDDLAWEIQEEVEAQVSALTGLNQDAKGLYRDENVFEDADIQMAGYAAALRVLTRYATIDGRDMTAEAIRPRVKGETTFVDGLISFAVASANKYLVPQGIDKKHWNKLSGAERFYLKMLEMEARGAKKLDNYQNFAKAFKVRNFGALMGDERANQARLRTAEEFGRAEMSDSSLFAGPEPGTVVPLRAVLYAVMELQNNIDGNEVLAHLNLNIPNYYSDMTQRQMAIELADYLARRLDGLRPDEASAARVLCELVKNQRLG